jgi:hypothetical protein
VCRTSVYTTVAINEEPPDVPRIVASFYGIAHGVVKSLLSDKGGAGFPGMREAPAAVGTASSST